MSVLGGLSAGVVLVSGDRRIVFANPVAMERFGSELVGQDLVRAIRHPDCLRALDDVLEGAEQAKADIVLQTPIRVTLQVTVRGLEPDDPSDARAVIC
ncbi:MAG: PAS domain-containing protein, partial [Aestuariivirgaceae bacterium]